MSKHVCHGSVMSRNGSQVWRWSQIPGEKAGGLQVQNLFGLQSRLTATSDHLNEILPLNFKKVKKEAPRRYS